MGPEDIVDPDRRASLADARVPLETEYLDLDHDGVPDAVQTTETVEYDTDAADLVEQIREVDAGIGPDGVPTTVTVTDMVTMDTDHDGVPDATEVTTVALHRAAPPDDH